MGVSSWTGPVESEKGFIPVSRNPDTGISTPIPFDIGIGPGTGNNVTNGQASDANVSMNRASTIFDMALASSPVPIGAGVPPLATNYFLNKIGGTIQTTIILDLGAGYANSSDTPSGVIGGGVDYAGKNAYIGRVALPYNGFPLKIEMVCMEKPTGGTPFIDLACNSQWVSPGDALTNPYLLIDGQEWDTGTAGRSDGSGKAFVTNRSYLYLVTGAATGTGVVDYTAGKFWIQITGANIDATTPT